MQGKSQPGVRPVSSLLKPTLPHDSEQIVEVRYMSDDCRDTSLQLTDNDKSAFDKNKLGIDLEARVKSLRELCDDKILPPLAQCQGMNFSLANLQRVKWPAMFNTKPNHSRKQMANTILNELVKTPRHGGCVYHSGRKSCYFYHVTPPVSPSAETERRNSSES